MARKGKTNNPHGRPKGSKNRDNKKLREFIEEIVNDRTQIQKDLKALEPLERLQIIEKLMGYVLPKLRSVENKIDFAQLTDEQIDLIIKEIKL